MGLNIFAIPISLKDFNPDWVLLILIYWVLAVPERVGVFNAWVIGLFVDVLTGRLLGQHALAYALIVYASLRFHKWLRQCLLPQQSLFIFFCLFFSQAMEFVIETFQGDAPQLALSFWMPAFTGILLTPFIYMALRMSRTSERMK